MLKFILVLCAVATVSCKDIVTQQCGPNGNGECNDNYFCVEKKFCLGDDWLNSPAILFVAGVASSFIDPNNVDEAKCLIGITAEIDDFLNALNDWNNGDYEKCGETFLSAVESFQSSIATCVSSSQSNESFWDEMWDGIKFVVEGLCSECGALISDAEFVVQGVDIIDDWAFMYNNCAGQPNADQLMDCGAAFGDSVQRIANAARAELLVRSEGSNLVPSRDLVTHEEFKIASKEEVAAKSDRKTILVENPKELKVYVAID